MTNFFERLVRGVEAASQVVGADEIAHTNPFDLSHSGAFPVASLKRRKSDGEIVVELPAKGGMSVMTVAEFGRFVEELAAFREVAAAAVEAQRRIEEK
jgi:hypothetical protein